MTPGSFRSTDVGIFPRTSGNGWAARGVTGRATHWSSRPPTSPISAPASNHRRRWRSAPVKQCTSRSNFRRLDTDTLLYEFTVDDPTTFTTGFTAAVPMQRSEEPMFEYACHEGNYGLLNILRGARADELASPDVP